MELNEMKIGETLNPVRLGIIAALLGGTMLNAYAEDTNASSGLSSEQAQVMLPAIEVHACVLEYHRGQGAGYVAKRSLIGSKTNSAVIDNPKSISTVTSQQMDDQGAHTVDQALRSQ